MHHEHLITHQLQLRNFLKNYRFICWPCEVGTHAFQQILITDIWHPYQNVRNRRVNVRKPKGHMYQTGVILSHLQDAWQQVSKVLQQRCVAFI